MPGWWPSFNSKRKIFGVAQTSVRLRHGGSTVSPSRARPHATERATRQHPSPSATRRASCKVPQQHRQPGGDPLVLCTSCHGHAMSCAPPSRNARDASPEATRVPGPARTSPLMCFWASISRYQAVNTAIMSCLGVQYGDRHGYFWTCLFIFTIVVCRYLRVAPLPSEGGCWSLHPSSRAILHSAPSRQQSVRLQARQTSILYPIFKATPNYQK